MRFLSGILESSKAQSAGKENVGTVLAIKRVNIAERKELLEITDAWMGQQHELPEGLKVKQPDGSIELEASQAGISRR